MPQRVRQRRAEISPHPHCYSEAHGMHEAPMVYRFQIVESGPQQIFPRWLAAPPLPLTSSRRFLVARSQDSRRRQPPSRARRSRCTIRSTCRRVCRIRIAYVPLASLQQCSLAAGEAQEALEGTVDPLGLFLQSIPGFSFEHPYPDRTYFGIDTSPLENTHRSTTSLPFDLHFSP